MNYKGLELIYQLNMQKYDQKWKVFKMKLNHMLRLKLNQIMKKIELKMKLKSIYKE